MSINLKAEKRDLQQKFDPNFYIPGILYGKKIENSIIKVKKNEFEKAWEKAGESNLIDLKINDSEAVKVIIKDVQFEPVKNIPIHVDFYQVNMKEKIITEIPLEFIGESKAVKELGGLLMKYTDEVEVKCLPGDLLDHIDVDISKLNSFEESIYMKDLKLPESMELLRDPDEIVVNVIAPKTDDQIAKEEEQEKVDMEKAEEKVEEINKEEKDEKQDEEQKTETKEAK
jgi:large subunit ribosomal protein L25